MKIALFASAAVAVALVAAPAFAQDVSGYAGVAYTYTDIEGEEFDAAAVEGSIASQADTGVGVQFDLGYGRAEDNDAFNSTVHVYTRNDAWAVGGFGGAYDDDTTTVWSAGAEGAMYFGDVTVAGTVAYATPKDIDDLDIWGAGAEVRYFVTENLRLAGNLNWADADVDTVWSAGVNAEYQLDATPVSIYAGYAHNEFDSLDVASDSVSVGVRYNFGGQTLKGRDRKGASFAGAKAVFGGLF